KELNGEIISADSWTVYKGFDIGTGKPSPSDQKAVKHYLIDVREASQGFNAPLFKEMAEQSIKNIQNRGKLPILAGGTGLYLDSVLYDFGFLDNSTPEERAKLDAMSLSDLLETAQLRKVDLTDIDKRNKRRVIRAIEAKGAKPTKGKLKPRTLIVGLKLEPDELEQRIEKRIDTMLAAGLEREVKGLADRFGWEIEPMKGIGYREWQAYFDGGRTLEETRQRIISATRGLAKRQRTWFKRNPDLLWFDSAGKAHQFIQKTLNT
ncbi:MAG TPA: tRNA (adenosine(37)-N6)-dimethylallyltransferase MiaA, partial [Candidatus Saccharimonadales bacterium]|nr:tRNA (adenosine(37)-N6)-dimethylallyltransferase MiaA [Candidatus Saccharimonadales bacterium]